MRSLRVLVAVAVLPALPAWADSQSDAIQLLDQGFELFKKGDPASLEQARKDFEQARALFPEKANPYRLLGLTNVRLGHCDEAVKNLDIFVKLTKKDDPRIFEVATIRDQCSKELGALSVESTPPGAEVRLDRADGPAVGVTPWKSENIPTGPHQVFVGKEGFATTSKSVTVEKRAPASVSATLVAQGAIGVASIGVASSYSPSRGRSRDAYFVVGSAAVAVVLLAVVVGGWVAASGHGGGPFATAIQFPAVMGK